MTITHRVVGTKKLDDGSTCLITRGDNNTQEDQACVKEQDIIGVTKAVIPGLGKIQFFLSSKLGWLLIIVLPALYIIVKDIIKIFNLSNDIKQNDKKSNSKDKKLNKAYEDLKKVKTKR